MKFSQIINKISAAVFLLLACACGKEPAVTVPVEPSGPDLSQYTVLSSIRVDAVSPGFACAGDQEGQLLGFEFETGDRIGVYAVLEGCCPRRHICCLQPVL